MNKELEQKAKELLYSYDLVNSGAITTDTLIRIMVEFAQQNALTLGTKLDENGERVDEPTYCSGCEECSGDCWATDYAIIYQKARTVKEWIEYAKELEKVMLFIKEIAEKHPNDTWMNQNDNVYIAASNVLKLNK